MITKAEYKDNGKYMGAVTLFGLSTDTKPITVANGSCFVEMDTSTIYFFNAAGSSGEEWIAWTIE